jgi:hypothetical protein
MRAWLLGAGKTIHKNGVIAFSPSKEGLFFIEIVLYASPHGL